MIVREPNREPKLLMILAFGRATRSLV
jgi:hypothetical protein